MQSFSKLQPPPSAVRRVKTSINEGGWKRRTNHADRSSLIFKGSGKESPNFAMTNESLAFPAIFLSESAQPLFSPNPRSPSTTFQHCAEHENSVRGLFNRSSFKISVTHKWNYSTGEESTLPPRFSLLSARPCLASPPPPPPPIGDDLDTSWSGSRWIENTSFLEFTRRREGRGKWNLIKGDDSINFRLNYFWWNKIFVRVLLFFWKIWWKFVLLNEFVNRRMLMQNCLCRDKTCVTCHDTNIT